MSSVMVAPSGHNTFVPDHESSGRMIVDFSRDIKSFAINRYIQIVPVKKTDGLYLEMTVEQAGRIVNSNLSDLVWPDGAEAPRSRDNLEEFRFLPYRTKRYAPDFVLGDLTAEQATWDIMAQHLRINAQRMMTARTVVANSLAVNTGNYAAGHHSDASAISGNQGTWAASTTARQDIKRSLETAAIVIQKATLGAIKLNEMILVINPVLAAAISQCQEIVDHIKGSPHAAAQVKGEIPGYNQLFGLPDKLYGFPLVVEDCVRVSTRKGASTSKTYVHPDATALMVSRPGGLEGVEGPSFSTISMFMQEEMTVEKKHDVDNRRLLGRVVDNWDTKVTAPSSGFVFTNCK